MAAAARGRATDLAADTWQVEDVADIVPIAPSEKLQSYPYDRDAYGQGGIMFVTAAEMEAGDIPRQAGLVPHELRGIEPGSQSSVRLDAEARRDPSIFPAQASQRDSVKSRRSVIQQRYMVVSSADATRYVNFYAIFYRSHPGVPVEWLDIMTDQEFGYAPFLMHRGDGLGAILFEENVSADEEATRLAERISTRTVEFNAWVDRQIQVLGTRRPAAGGVHGIVIITVGPHLFEVAIGPSTVMITNRVVAPTDQPVFVDNVDSGIDWLPMTAKGLAWRQQRQHEKGRRFREEVKEARADPYPNYSHRFDPPFIPGLDPRRAGQIVVVPSTGVAGMNAEEVMAEQLSRVFTPPALWSTLGGDFEERNAKLTNLLYTETGEPTGLTWPPAPLAPSRIYFGASSHPPFGPNSQATPFILRWPSLVDYGISIPITVVLGDDQFFHLIAWAADLPVNAALIKDYHIEIDNIDPDFFYSRPNFRIDRARDLLALIMWRAAPGGEYNALSSFVQDMHRQKAAAQRPDEVDLDYAWSSADDRDLPAFMVVMIGRQASPAAAEIFSVSATEDVQMGVAPPAELAATGVEAPLPPPAAGPAYRGARRRASLNRAMQMDRAADGAAF